MFIRSKSLGGIIVACVTWVTLLNGVRAVPDVASTAEVRTLNDDLTCSTSSYVPSRARTQWALRRSVDEISLAVLPLGAIEQHGPHLPLGTDLLLAEAFAGAIADNLGDRGVAVLPASPFGASFEHANLPGTIAIQDSSLQGLWGSIIESVASTGVQRVILLNAHGGQTPNAQIAIRRARFETNSPVLAVLVNLQALIHDSLTTSATIGDLDEQETAWERVHGIHGGLVETALMLHLHPNLVDTASAQQFLPFSTPSNSSLTPYGAVVSYGWKADDIFPSGVGGFASRATPGLGKEIFRDAVTALLQIVKDTQDAVPSTVLRAPKSQRK
jgi:creatinine amidohydrolase